MAASQLLRRRPPEKAPSSDPLPPNLLVFAFRQTSRMVAEEEGDEGDAIEVPVETLPRAASSRGDSRFPQSAAAGCPSRVHPLATTGHLPTSTPRLSRLLPSRLVDPVAAALVGEHDGDKIGNLTGDTEARGRRGTVAAWMWSRGGVEASGREELDLGPRRLPSLHLFLVLLVIYMVFLVGRCFVVLIRHSAVPRSSMKKPRRKADQQCPRSTRTSQPDVYMIQVSFSTPRFGP